MNVVTSFMSTSTSLSMSTIATSHPQAKFQDQPAYTEAIYSTAVSGNIVVTSDGSTFQMSFP